MPNATADPSPAHSMLFKDRIPTFYKAMFSAGASTDCLADTLTVGVLWLLYFNIGLGGSILKCTGIVATIQQQIP